MPHTTTFELCLPYLTRVAASTYLSLWVELKHLLEALDCLTTRVDSQKLLIDMEANAHSQLWHHPSNDSRRYELADWIQTANLLIANQPPLSTSHWVTENLCTSRESWIDITPYGSRIAPHLQDWKVLNRETLSDHRHLTCNLNLQPRLNNSVYATPRLLHRKGWLGRVRQLTQSCTCRSPKRNKRRGWRGRARKFCSPSAQVTETMSQIFETENENGIEVT